MATVRQVLLTCDVCGDSQDVRTWTFGLDHKAYEIDLCRKDGKGLSEAVAGYTSKARKTTAGQRSRRTGRPPRSRAGKPPRSRAGKPPGPDRGGAPGGRVSGRPRGTGSVPQPQRKGICVYGIMPADIEVASDIRGVGEHPGLLRVVRFDGLAALISEVDRSGRLGSPGDLRVHREILDATATEVPVLPLRFGTILASEDAVAEELLAVHRDEFAAGLEQLEGRAEFLVKGRYVKDAILGEVLAENKLAARLRDTIAGQDGDAARDAGIELGEILTEAVTARREEDTRRLGQAMEEVCVASVAREPAHELDALHVAFLADVEREADLEQVIDDLARDWEGRIEVRLLGPTAAYDFAGTAKPGG